MAKNKNELIKALKNLTGKEVNGDTKGEVLKNFNASYADVSLTIVAKAAGGDAVASSTVVLKKGDVVGSGDTVTASAGKYSVKFGKYNYSISAIGYTTKTGVIDITLNDVDAGAKEVVVTLATA